MGEGGIHRIIHGEAEYCSDKQGFAIASSLYQHLKRILRHRYRRLHANRAPIGESEIEG